MTGYSLHIGLNRVDPAAYGGWDGALGGCVNDANSMRDLASRQQFRTTQLLDGQATSHAVIGEISLLAQQAVPGDICLITYSGHGGQVDDVNGDEEDAQDETWVLYDRQVVDDELFQMWSQFMPGVRVLVLSDSCHSGTVLKSVIAPRGRQDLAKLTVRRDLPELEVEPRLIDLGARELAVEPVELAVTPKNMPIPTQVDDNERRRGTYQFVQALSGPRAQANVQASVMLISGCQDNQLSYDGPVNGQFTGTLLRVWAGGAFQGDYQAFHRAILAQMPPDQSPNLYTVGLDDPAFMSQRPFTVEAPSTPVVPTPTPVSPTTGPRPTLRQGAVGPDVAYLQQRLNAHGASLTSDGVFGPMTTSAVRSFQSTQGLTADGVVGPMTWNALDTVPVTGGTPVGGGSGTSAGGSSGSGGTGTSTGGGAGWNSGGQPGGEVGVAARPTVRRGSTGAHVEHLQTRLLAHGYHVAVDGIFGPGTESAVRSFQRSNSLVADGVVGPRTWEVLG